MGRANRYIAPIAGAIMLGLLLWSGAPPELIFGLSVIIGGLLIETARLQGRVSGMRQVQEVLDDYADENTKLRQANAQLAEMLEPALPTRPPQP